MKELREYWAAQGLRAPKRNHVSNRKSAYGSVEEEQIARQEATERQLRLMRSELPKLLADLSRIPDFRNPRKTKHAQRVLMAYGILMFVFQSSSRRDANQKMTRPMFVENLQQFFPDLAELPHQDTLNRFLDGIGEHVTDIEAALCKLIGRLMRRKTFRRYLIDGRYGIAIDGTQKLVRKEDLSPEWLERHVGKKDDNNGRPQYYVYVVEASLVLRNGLTIPLMSEFLNADLGDLSSNKQDCEIRGFYRLADRLKKHFPRLPVLLLLDALFANGPVMAACREKRWAFMIVLKDDVLTSAWDEFYGLRRFQPENRFGHNWQARKQYFQWVNDIEYSFDGRGTGRRRITVHVVTCDEHWEEIGKDNARVEKGSRHVWLSSRPITAKNVHVLCNLGGRRRWGIENCFNEEKHHGYQYEHCFSFSWTAMRGYHYLMRIGHALNVLALLDKVLLAQVRNMGTRRFIEFVRETLANPWYFAGSHLKSPSPAG